ncbi:MAG TPA: DUF934 domain-containing protein [Myxococcota bacterium]|nr:DUF934 domain-containing protein [Myxococcota bacterium]
MALLERQPDGSARVIEDPFARVDDESPIPDSGAVLVSLDRFESEREALLARGEGLGVLLEPDDAPAAIADDLDRIDLVAVDFPVFSDGRGFSTARLLRERHGFEGQLRAVGDVLCEQLPFMLRSGFDAFEMASEHALEEYEAVVGEVRVVYQPTGDGRDTVLDRRLGRA